MQLNGWQRMWIVFSVLMLLGVLFMLWALWPHSSLGVISDLADPRCKPWKEVSFWTVVDQWPSIDEPCYSIKGFLYTNKTPIQSVAEYERFLTWAKVKAVGTALGIWIGMIAAVYISGWAVGWVARGFHKQTAS